MQKKNLLKILVAVVVLGLTCYLFVNQLTGWSLKDVKTKKMTIQLIDAFTGETIPNADVIIVAQDLQGHDSPRRWKGRSKNDGIISVPLTNVYGISSISTTGYSLYSFSYSSKRYNVGF